LLREVIVVEGKKDVAAVSRAVEADCILTGGFTLGPMILAQIQAAADKRGIIILTDPDTAGEKIRRYLSKRFPDALHAFVARGAASDQTGKAGVEYAKPQEILTALARVRTTDIKKSAIFSTVDLLRFGLSGHPSAGLRRQQLGEKLGIGWCNAKTFLARLNNYGVTRDEFETAAAEWEEALERTDDRAQGSDPAHIATLRNPNQ